MKKTLLILGAALMAQMALAQNPTNAEVTGNTHTASRDGFAWDLKGSAGANCSANGTAQTTGGAIVKAGTQDDATVTHNFRDGIFTITQTAATTAIYATATVFNFVEKGTTECEINKEYSLACSCLNLSRMYLKIREEQKTTKTCFTFRPLS